MEPFNRQRLPQNTDKCYATWICLPSGRWTSEKKIITSLVTVLNNKAASALVIRNFEKKLIYKQV